MFRSLKLKIAIVVVILATYMVGVMSFIFIISGSSGGSSVCIDTGTMNVTENVLKWRPIIEKYAKEFEVEEYVPLMLALTMQESGGNHLDVMQASEGAFNTKYSKAPNSITDPDYSIWCGVQEFKHAITIAGVESPLDIKNISMALQGYNFGPAWVPWAKERGGYSKPLAYEFSRIWAGKMGWPRYGDPEYVPHVLRYYNAEASGSSSCYEDFAGGGELGDVVSVAMAQRGRPYIWGAMGPTSFDCSGLVYWAYKEAGYVHGRNTAQGYYNIATLISNPSPGDLVFFRYGNAKIHHIGIYIGEGKMVHAPQPGDVVKVAELNTLYWQNIHAGYGRLNIPKVN